MLLCRSSFDQPKGNDNVTSQDSNLMADWEVIDGEVSSKKPPPPAVKVKPRNRLATAENGDERKKPIVPSPQKGKEMVSTPNNEHETN